MDGSTGTTRDPRPLIWLRVAVSSGTLLVALAHLVWPDVVIDATTVALIVIAILPWVAPMVKSLELPGGWSVEFRDLQRAASRAESAGLLSLPLDASPVSLAHHAQAEFSFQTVARRDARLALAGLGIEIENRLSQLAKAYGVDPGRSAGSGQLLRALSKAEVLKNEEREVLSDTTSLLNAAAHGAAVDKRAADWVIDVGPRLLRSLDARVAAEASAHPGEA